MNIKKLNKNNALGHHKEGIGEVIGEVSMKEAGHGDMNHCPVNCVPRGRRPGLTRASKVIYRALHGADNTHFGSLSVPAH